MMQKMFASPDPKEPEAKLADVPKIYNIVDQDAIVGPSRRDSVLATPDRVFRQGLFCKYFHIVDSFRR